MKVERSFLLIWCHPKSGEEPEKIARFTCFFSSVPSSLRQSRSYLWCPWPHWHPSPDPIPRRNSPSGICLNSVCVWLVRLRYDGLKIGPSLDPSEWCVIRVWGNFHVVGGECRCIELECCSILTPNRLIVRSQTLCGRPCRRPCARQAWCHWGHGSFFGFKPGLGLAPRHDGTNRLGLGIFVDDTAEIALAGLFCPGEGLSPTFITRWSDTDRSHPWSRFLGCWRFRVAMVQGVYL